MTLDKVDADKAELTRTIQSVDNKVKKVIAYIPLEGATLTQAQKDTNSKRFDGNKDFNCLVFVSADGKTSVEGAGSQIIYVRGSHIQYIDGTNVIEATVSTSGEVKTKVVQTFGGLQYALERTAYVTKTKMGNNVNDTEITEEQRAYNIETLRLACIEDKAVIISREGVIFSSVYKSNTGENFTLSANIGNLLNCTLYMRKNGDAEIEISNAVDTKLDLDSINPVQNKVVADKLLRLNEILLHYDDSGLDSDRKGYNVNYLNFLGQDATARLMCIYNNSVLMPITSYKSDNSGGIYAYVMVNGTEDASSKQIKVHFKADGSAEKIGEVAGGALSAPERIVYFENPNTTAKLTDEQKAYNAETYKRVQIDDLPVFFSWYGHWGYQKEGTFGDPNGYMIIGFLIGDKELSVKITADGSGSQIAISNVVDSELSETSTNAIQNKVVTAAIVTLDNSVAMLSQNLGLLDTQKVDKVSGKQLSTEDFTSVLKTKLESLNNYDDTSIRNAVNSLTTQINTLVSGDASAAIESFNENIAFLNGVEDSENLDSIIATIEQQIAGKQDKLVSGTNIKTINGESILGEGNIVVSADISNFATKEELANLSNEIIANEEITATAINDLNTRLAALEAAIANL